MNYGAPYLMLSTVNGGHWTAKNSVDDDAQNKTI